MKNRKIFPMLVYLLVLYLLMNWATGGFGRKHAGLSHNQIVELFQEEQVKSFIIEGNEIELKLHGTYDGKTTLLCALGDPDYFRIRWARCCRSRSKAVFWRTMTSWRASPSPPWTTCPRC